MKDFDFGKLARLCEENDRRLDVLNGQLIAAKDVIAALLETHPNRDVVLTVMSKYSAVTESALAEVIAKDPSRLSVREDYRSSLRSFLDSKS